MYHNIACILYTYSVHVLCQKKKKKKKKEKINRPTLSCDHLATRNKDFLSGLSFFKCMNFFQLTQIYEIKCLTNILRLSVIVV